MCGVNKLFLIVGLLMVCGGLSRANPLKQIEENEIEREKRQMKGENVNTEQAGVKFLGAGPALAATANGVIEAVTAGVANNNLQSGRFSPYGNALMLQGGYAQMPGGFGGYGGFGINNGLGGFGGQAFVPNGGLGAAGGLTNYPSGLEMYPGYMYGGGLYPNAIAPIAPAPPGAGGIPPIGGPLDNYGLNTQLLAQSSQLQPQQILPYPVMPGLYPQMGYSPAFQNFQG